MTPLNITVLLCDAFSNMVLACLLEPLRVVRDQTGAKIQWRILTETDETVTSSSGLTVSPEGTAKDAAPAELVILVGGDAFRQSKRGTTGRNLAKLSAGKTIIAADTGAWMLARAGLLDGRKATLHWQLLEEFSEAFPDVHVLPDSYVRDGRYWTCGSAAAALDLMLHFIRTRFGAATAFDAGAMFLHDNSKQHDPSRPDRTLLHNVSPKLRTVVALMSETLETPETVPQLARHAHVSERTLRRLFWDELQTTPGRYYLHLRLSRAKELLKFSAHSPNEIALRCGFASATTLTRSLRRAEDTALR